jgi:ribonuclease P protein component
LKEKVRNYEENVPTEQAEAKEHAWLSEADEDGGWKKGARSASRQGAQAPRREDVIFGAAGEGSMPRFFKAKRLTRQEEFAAVRARGIVARSGAIVVAALPGGERRLGLAVSSRVGGAVVRNRIKRLIREFFRCHPETFPTGDCVVIPQQGAGKQGNEQLREQLARALHALSSRVQSGGRRGRCKESS